MIILLHSSKTMRPPTTTLHTKALTVPEFQPEAEQLMSSVANMSPEQLMTVMSISRALADKVVAQHHAWQEQTAPLAPAAYVFAGDIYSGLGTHTWTADDARFAQQYLRILSGLYGMLRPFDGIRPYRLEMGYRLPTDGGVIRLETYWRERLSNHYDTGKWHLNLCSAEYASAVVPLVEPCKVVTPTFLTIHPASGKPTFVAVHAKIARGAMAQWAIKQRVAHPRDIEAFAQLGYTHQPEMSTTTSPVFVCKSFEGLGLSVRLR